VGGIGRALVDRATLVTVEDRAAMAKHKPKQEQDGTPTSAEIEAAVRTLRRAARQVFHDPDGLRITITIEPAPTATARAYERSETWVRALREKLSMTHEDLAERLEVNARAVRRWERGESVPQRTRTIRILNAHVRDVGMPDLPLSADHEAPSGLRRG
jgi:DNA-binding transcriptional regulator YiaG